jgi:hypothetical protein
MLGQNLWIQLAVWTIGSLLALTYSALFLLRWRLWLRSSRLPSCAKKSPRVSLALVPLPSLALPPAHFGAPTEVLAVLPLVPLTLPRPGSDPWFVRPK